jgi:hypothetical protein
MGPQLTINLQGTERRVPNDLWRIWLLPGEPETGVVIRVPIDPEAPVRWEELDQLPELREIQYSGRDVRVLEYLAARPDLNRLAWSDHRQTLLDFSRTTLGELSLDCGPGPLEVRLPTGGTLERLSLAPAARSDALSPLRRGGRVGLEVHAPEAGAGISLTLRCQGLPDGPEAIPGLERICALSLWGVREVRLECLLAFQELEELTIFGPPGTVTGLRELARFPKLRRLRLRECYSLGVEALPPASAFPALESVEVDGVRQADAVVLAERLAGLGSLSIRGKRSDSWLRANLDNPFREWSDEHGSATGKAAMAAYRKAVTALDRAGSDAALVQAALHAFVEAFNRRSARDPFDTIQREEVSDAFDELASRVTEAVPLATAREWFDEWEDL